LNVQLDIEPVDPADDLAERLDVGNVLVDVLSVRVDAKERFHSIDKEREPRTG